MKSNTKILNTETPCVIKETLPNRNHENFAVCSLVNSEKLYATAESKAAQKLSNNKKCPKCHNQRCSPIKPFAPKRCAKKSITYIITYSLETSACKYSFD